MATLNDAQRLAATFGVAGRGQAGEATAHPPLLIIAGAGSGKTSTLAQRVVQLVAGGVDPGRILLLTFSRRAAAEMSRRVERLLVRRPGSAALPWAGTFHSVGARLLREYAGRIGLDPAFTIHDRQDSADLINLVRHQLGFSAKTRRFPLKGSCLAIYSAVINTRDSLADVLQGRFPWSSEWESELRQLFQQYVEAKQSQQVLDYDDLLLYWAQMVGDAELGAEIGERFTHLLVDEYQDTNRLQASILLGIKPDGRGVTVVGDDAQAIYAFRGATVRNILDFPAQFAPPAERLTLERNYRSTQPILAAANAVIALAAERYAKNLWSDRPSSAKPRLVSLRDDADQVEFVVDQTLARRERGIPLKAQAVLFRTASHSARLEIELTRRNIPFVKFGGLRFLEAAHVKDVLAILRWAQNPRDRIAGFRAVQLVAGIGPKTASRVLANVADAAPGSTLLADQPVPEGARVAWLEFAALIATCGPDGPPWPALFDRICAWYATQIDRLHDEAAVRLADIEQLARIAMTYPAGERFLTELTLDPPEATSDEAGPPLLDDDYLVLSTIHSAKGQEWTAVTILNAVDGCIPSDMATGSTAGIEEERRLLYVAMTRARDELDLIVPQRFYTGHQPGLGDRHVYASRTRFIPHALLGHFAQITWPKPADAAPGVEDARQQVLDLAARMRAMWL
ncbi:MAG: ATP-dependent helicase [Candidatus Accumulibacter sp.]|uniref:ATP-dependent helicase n=1 Tax=Accumulibacter sp. TaxID=2053492 RepID=UPI0025F8C686|nr:ATP-dependent helicase [Accumulibacter sp.]MCM8596487.1 ATP-dependent helicase [Accumulibacter sp.]MCM8627341.1 ATP-dependent helicase [Accumulibacter sp.]MDS4050635.1 ATP-dependent helicase [Accumulibacter sp.]